MTVRSRCGRGASASHAASAKALGIAAIYQQPALFAELTVAENIALGIEQTGRWGRVDWASDIGAQSNARPRRREHRPRVIRGRPRHGRAAVGGDRARVGRGCARLILDEPTASLSKDDADNLFRVVRELRAKAWG
jgi:rhamnose transport system ATP-binding protein